ncbi:unnamed protein product, partial [Linum tenue]
SLNTDGSVISTPESTAAGGVIRDEEGLLLRAFTMNLGGGSITKAEIAGITDGLQIAWDLGLKKVQVQTDSKIAMQLLHEATSSNPHHCLIAAARRLLARDWQVEIIHMYREGNVVADFLASLGHSRGVGLHVLDRPNSSLNYWLFFDLLGVQTLRLINNNG